MAYCIAKQTKSRKVCETFLLQLKNHYCRSSLLLMQDYCKNSIPIYNFWGEHWTLECSHLIYTFSCLSSVIRTSIIQIFGYPNSLKQVYNPVLHFLCNSPIRLFILTLSLSLSLMSCFFVVAWDLYWGLLYLHTGRSLLVQFTASSDRQCGILWLLHIRNMQKTGSNSSLGKGYQRFPPTLQYLFC